MPSTTGSEKVPQTASEAWRDQLSALTGFSHEAIAKLYEGWTEEKQLRNQTLTKHFTAWEYVPGDTLETIINKGPLDEKETKEFIEQIGSGLAALHEKGIIVKDVSPQNIIRTPQGNYKLIDLGEAIDTTEDERGLRTARIKTMGGAAQRLVYFAPEREIGAEGPYTDIYGLALTAINMLRGKHGQPELSEKELQKISPTLRETLARSVQGNYSKRPQSIDEFMHAIRPRAQVAVNENKTPTERKLTLYEIVKENGPMTPEELKEIVQNNFPNNKYAIEIANGSPVKKVVKNALSKTSEEWAIAGDNYGGGKKSEKELEEDRALIAELFPGFDPRVINDMYDVVERAACYSVYGLLGSAITLMGALPLSVDYEITALVPVLLAAGGLIGASFGRYMYYNDEDMPKQFGVKKYILKEAEELQNSMFNHYLLRSID